MTKINPPNFLKKERETTDNSLITERDKTDESLALLQRKTERETDALVKDDRKNIDEARALNRTETDHDKDIIRQSGDDESLPDKSERQRSVDHLLTEQREWDDASVLAERARMDEVMMMERGQKLDMANLLLGRERNETDENLLLERVKTDHEVEQSKAALLNRDELMAIVSHDLRNPIGSILSYSQLLIEDAKSFEINQELSQLIQIIKRNAETSLRLINDILDMERFAEGKLTLEISSVDLNKLINHTIENLTHIAKEKGISLSADLDLNPVLINCDGDRIMQVIANLMGNALKFTPEGGTIILKLSRNVSGVEISITDSGAGIEKEQLTKIFERYSQINNKDRQGLGLGLYISKMLVEAHHGQLSVKSTVNKGSTFSFSLKN